MLRSYRVVLVPTIAAATMSTWAPLAQADDSCANSPTPTKEAVEAYNECKDKVSGTSGKGKAFIVDADKKVGWIIDKDGGGGGAECFELALGSNSVGDPATLGNTKDSNETPPGLLLTTPHSSDKYPNGTSLGLKGTGSGNDMTEERGVLIHPAHSGATAGCIGIKAGAHGSEEQGFEKVKEELGDDRAPVFVWGEKLDKAKACDGAGGGSPSGGSGGSGGASKSNARGT